MEYILLLNISIRFSNSTSALVSNTEFEMSCIVTVIATTIDIPKPNISMNETYSDAMVIT